VRVNDYLLRAWKDRAHVDSGKVGVFGFSAGGTAALVAAGGEPDFSRVEPWCRTHPEFVCKLMRPGLRAPSPAEWTHDRRIGAAVVVSPGFGFAFEPAGLSGVRAPVQLWAGAADDAVPVATNTEVVRKNLPFSPDFHLVPDAGHVAFLAPCGLTKPLLPPQVCSDPKGFDRAAFHKAFNRSVVAFFDRNLSGAARPEA
jgi:predicted dienelactone hydrolase